MNKVQMNVKDENVFLVTGYFGETPLPENMFMGYCIAVDAQDALSYMGMMFSGLRVSGLNTLAQVRNMHELLEKVKSGLEQAPVTPRMASAG